jgi:hypothetical protein
MRCLLAFAAAVALLVASGACGNIISLPDQGVFVLGCKDPSACYLANCSCKRADAQPGGSCITAGVTVAANPVQCTATDVMQGVPCVCPATINLPVPNSDMTVPVSTQCQESAMVCIGRGVFCAVGSHCVAAGKTCSDTGDPPQLVSVGMDVGDAGIPDAGPGLEPHCQYVDDVCCPGAVIDASVSD